MPYVYPKTLHDYDHDHTNQSKNASIPEIKTKFSRTIADSSSNSIFLPASTSKYPIKESTIQQEFHERFVNFISQWINTIVYLARKWNITSNLAKNLKLENGMDT